MHYAGQWSDMVVSTIDLGISILMGGNTDVQKVHMHLVNVTVIVFFLF